MEDIGVPWDGVLTRPSEEEPGARIQYLQTVSGCFRAIAGGGEGVHISWGGGGGGGLISLGTC